MKKIATPQFRGTEALRYGAKIVKYFKIRLLSEILIFVTVW